MKFLVLTLFPDFFDNLQGLIQSAREKNVFQLETLNIRSFGQGKHQKVDDQVYGGGDGMLLSPEVLDKALLEAQAKPGYENAKVVALTPKGKVWNQNLALEWSQKKDPVILVCGRYAGFDQRWLNLKCDLEISVGDYILNGGEVAAMVVVESVARLLPETLSNSKSITEDSFSAVDLKKLEAPQYTKPQEWQGLRVPSVLTSGHHQNILQWQQASSLTETYFKRQDLWSKEHSVSLKKLFLNPETKKNVLDNYSEKEKMEIVNFLKDVHV